MGSVSLESVPKNVQESVCSLPSFPPLAVRALRILSAESVELDEVVSLIGSDPAFSAGVVQMANSPLYGCMSRITSVGHAVILLGLDRTKAVLTTIAIKGALQRNVRRSVARRVWKHSLACAVLSRELSALTRTDPERAYTLGLVHDLGRLGLLSAYPEKYGQILANSHASSAALLEAEQKAFDADHCKAGMWLARTLDFPQEMVEAATFHHDAGDATEPAHLRLVRIACKISDALGFSVAHYENNPNFQDVYDESTEDTSEALRFGPKALAERATAHIGALAAM